MTAPVDTSVSIAVGVHASAAETRATTDISALRDARKNRYVLQRIARDILRGVPHPARGSWRTMSCGVDVTGGAVSVRYTPAISRASYVGACICASGWVCAVCSARISELRRIEIAAAHAVHAAAGGSACMVTVTTPHAQSDELRTLLGRRRQSGRTGLSGAMQRWRNDRATHAAVNALGRVVWIRATEITHGGAGWHPHYHELWLTTCPPDDRIRVAAQRELLRAWQRAVRNAGLGDANRYGLDLRWAWDASGYLAKAGQAVELTRDAIVSAERGRRWSPARELASAATKRGRKGSRTPWQLLRDAAGGDTRARTAWVDYVRATYRMPQLIWQRGAKAALAIEDRTDQQLAQHADEESYVLAVIPADRWRALLSLPYEWRARLLDLAEDGGPDAIHDFLDLLEVDPELARVYAGIDPQEV